MHTSYLRKVGGSVMLLVPPAILDMLELQAGATVSLAVNGKRLTVEPQPRPHYALDQLLAQCDPKAPLPRGDKAWLEIAPAGKEL